MVITHGALFYSLSRMMEINVGEYVMCAHCSGKTSKFLCHFGGHEAQEFCYPNTLENADRNRITPMSDPCVVSVGGNKVLCCAFCEQRLGLKATRLSDHCNADYRKELCGRIDPKISYCAIVLEMIGYEAPSLVAELVA